MTTVIGKTYSSRSNAVRAAKKSFGTGWEGTVEIEKTGKSFIITAKETTSVLKMNSRLGVRRALPTPKQPVGTPRRKGAVAELWEIFDELQRQNMRRVDILDTCVEKGYNYWTVRTQLQLFMKALRADTVSNAK